jgi:hypothetical protein
MKKRKPGRPKGSRNKPKSENKLITALKEGVAFAKGEDNRAKVTTFVPETPTFLSRLEAATVKYEQAIKEAIEALKGN